MSGSIHPLKRKTEGDEVPLPKRLKTSPTLIVPMGVPWMTFLTNDVLEMTDLPPIARLGFEIQALGQALAPNPTDTERRLGFIECLKRRLHRYFHGCQVHPAGSTATGLYLPGSDIDLTLTWDRAGVQFAPADAEDCFLANVKALLESDENPGNIQHRRSANVPVIAIEGSYGFYDVDISFNRLEGPRAVDLLRRWQRTSAVARPMVFIVKLFLAANNLNKPYDGGLGGFAIVIMVYWFLQVHYRIVDCAVDPADPHHWGELLVDFLELFGDHFEYRRFGVSLRNGGSYVTRSEGQAEFYIEDPYKEGNNVAVGCRVGALRQAFRHARVTLQNALWYQVDDLRSQPNTTWASFLGKVGRTDGSLLHAVIGFDNERLSCVEKAERVYPVADLRAFLQANCSAS